MTPKAAAAFADYVGLGAGRSLAGLASLYAAIPRSATKQPPTRHLDTLKAWSQAHEWQERIAEAVTERTMALLAEAAELDADTFLAISREYRRRTAPDLIGAVNLNDVHPIRDRVRDVAAKAPGVTVNIVIRQEAERLAAELGMTADDLLADAERIAAAAWEQG